MSIEVCCPGCRTAFVVEDKFLHRTIRCHRCGTEFEALPAEEEQAQQTRPSWETLDVAKDSTPETPSAPEVRTGESFGKYEILEELGRGGMGIVYKAFDPELKRTVALKMLIGDQNANSQTQVERFIREARAAAKLKHPNIVNIYDFGEETGKHYFTMDFVKGTSLEDALADREKHGLSPRRTIEIVRDIANALAYAHSEGIIHRDIKPANILLDSGGKPYLTDFGLAKEVESPEKSLTMTGYLMGTPYYMSPEQAQGEKDLDARSDVFSLGAVMYEALADRKPFTGTQVYEILDSVVKSDPPAPRSISRLVHRDIETICMKCLEKEKHRRYQSAKELSEDISRFLEGEPILARSTGIATRVWKKAKRNKLAFVAVSISVLILLAVAASILVSRARTVGRIETLLGQAHDEFEGGNFTESRALCEKVLELSPHNLEALFIRKECRLEIDKRDKKLREEKEAAEQVAREKEDAKQRRDKAQAILDQFDHTTYNNDKIRACDDALQIDPTFGLAWQEKGLAHLALKDYDKAFDCFTTAIELSPKLAMSYWGRARINLQIRNRPKDSERDVEIFEKINPEKHLTFCLKGLLEYKRNNITTAIKYYAKAIELNPDFNIAYWYRATVYTAQGKYTEAIQDLTEAIRIKPVDALYYIARAHNYDLTGQYRKAIPDLSKAIEIGPESDNGYYLRGWMHYKAGDYVSALPDFSKAIEMNPRLALAYFYRGEIHVNAGELDKALDDFDKVINIDPNWARAYAYRGALRDENGNIEGAIDDMTEFLKRAPSDPLAPNVKKKMQELKKQLKK